MTERVRALAETGITPGLAAVLVGDDQASRIYVGQKHKACADVGIRSEQVDLPSYVTEHELLATIRRLNRDPEIHGIMLQLPLPGHLHELEIQRAIAPEKDVDGLHPWNIGMMLRQGPCFLPATPYGIVELLLRAEIPIEGAEVTIVGFGELVGRATVGDARRRTRSAGTPRSPRPTSGHATCEAHTLAADIVVAAAGVPHLIDGRHDQAGRHRRRRGRAPHARRADRRRDVRRGRRGRRARSPRCPAGSGR